MMYIINKRVNLIELVKVHILYSPQCLSRALPYLVPDHPTATLYVLDLIDDLSLPPDTLLQAHHKDLLLATFVNALEHLP